MQPIRIAPERRGAGKMRGTPRVLISKLSKTNAVQARASSTASGVAPSR